jgi:hypothetical protein
MGELADQPEESFTTEFVNPLRLHSSVLMVFGRERREHRVFQELLKSVPGLEERLMEGSEEEVGLLAELVSSQSVSSTNILTVHVDRKGGLRCSRG